MDKINFDFTTSGMTVAGFTIVLWLLRNWILTRMKESISHEYDRKIEDVRSNARQLEVLLRADLAASQSQIEALRNGVLSNISNRQAIKHQKS